MSVKRLLIVSSCLLMLTACHQNRKHRYAGATAKKQRDYLPKDYHDLYLGMPKAKALKARPNLKLELDESFRDVYVEKHSAGAITTTVYYFDDDGDQPLYEFILLFNDNAVRDQVANQLFGSPNHDTEEWMYRCREGFRIHAWTFKEKLIIVGKLDGTEWAEDQNLD